MGKMKQLSEEQDLIEFEKHRDSMLAEFHNLQKTLLKHKYLYYVKSNPIISDYDYDMMEDSSLKFARTLGLRADKWEGPEKNEKDHIHWMVDFDETHPLAQEIIQENK